jgi:hypothetical protein
MPTAAATEDSHSKTVQNRPHDFTKRQISKDSSRTLLKWPRFAGCRLRNLENNQVFQVGSGHSFAGNAIETAVARNGVYSVYVSIPPVSVTVTPDTLQLWSSPRGQPEHLIQ